MKRIKLKKIKKKNPVVSFIIVLLTSVFLLSSILIYYISNTITPILLSYAEFQVERLGNQIINGAISKRILDKLDIEELFITIQNKEGQVVTVDFNPVIANKILNDASYFILRNMKAVEEGDIHLVDGSDYIFTGYDMEVLKRGIIYEIPLGATTRVALLSNIGPKVPVRFAMAGSLNTNLSTKLNNYGINSVIMEVFIDISVSNQVILPLMSKVISYKLSIPVATKIIQGKVPKYYQQGINQSSPILSIPME
ncbi:MAG: sporulation protein YunB [Bacilli bacterium]|nr:sporulation protein YunB [Bacilli bacterium]